MLLSKNIRLLFIPFYIGLLTLMLSSCGVYKFTDASVDPDLKNIRIQGLLNNAPYVNPQVNQNLTERLRQKIVNQTRLSQTNRDDAHLDVSGAITDYSVSTTGISDKREVTNRLSVTVHIIMNNQLKATKEEFDVSRTFEFEATLSLQQAENRLMDEMVRSLTDDIFNRMFSNW